MVSSGGARSATTRPSNHEGGLTEKPLETGRIQTTSTKNFASDFKARAKNSCRRTIEFPPTPPSAAILRCMKGKQRTPLWLICDVSACLRLHIAMAILLMVIRRFLPRHRPPTPEGIAWITAWQAGCERLLRWAIARQAFRLCGLDPNLARNFEISEAQNSFAWVARGRAFIHMYETMTAIARRWAKRIRECTDDSDDSGTPIPATAIPATIFRIPNPNPANFRIPKNPAIRGPPRLLADSRNTSPAPCRSIGEVAGVCVSA